MMPSLQRLKCGLPYRSGSTTLNSLEALGDLATGFDYHDTAYNHLEVLSKPLFVLDNLFLCDSSTHHIGKGTLKG
jgi:hypothetical protein